MRPWRNTQGESGPSAPLTLVEAADGSLTGHWDCDLKNVRRTGNIVTADMTGCGGRTGKRGDSHAAY